MTPADDLTTTLGGAVAGLGPRQVRLVPHDPAWAPAFAREAARLRQGLGRHALAVEHIGSTAVPGLAAKPILDLMVATPALKPALELESLLAGLGYAHRPLDTIPGRLLFVGNAGDLRLVNLSLTEPGSVFWRDHLAFRDRLRADPALAAAYTRLKAQLAAQFPGDRLAYTAAKDAFVAAALAAPEPTPGHASMWI
ncbi:MAG: GrpB family protein [Thermomicrobiales bacterium]